MFKGIDVSDNNGKIDWQRVKSSGIDFAIIRLGYGNDDPSQDDLRFNENVAACEAVGLPWGAYIYSYAMNNDEAVSEAKHCLRLLNGKKPSYPICLDMEDADGYKRNRGGLSAEMTVQICNTFLSILEENGYYVSLYASLSWLNGILNDKRLDRFDKWVAQWYTECEYGGDYGLWQYGGSTNFIESPYLSGINGTVDKNYAFYDYPTVIKENGLNGWHKSEELKEEPVVQNEKLKQENITPDNKPKEKSGFLSILKSLIRFIIEWARSEENEKDSYKTVV